MREEFCLNSDDRILQFASISFDIAVEELFPSWLSGATVVLRSDKMLSSSADFLQSIQQERVSVLNLPTAFWHEWVHDLSIVKDALPPTLRLVIVGGEKASPTAYSTWLKVGGDRIRWLNAYGTTETTVTATVYEPVTVAENQEVISDIMSAGMTIV